MKKILLSLIVCILITSLVFAQEQGVQQNQQQDENISNIAIRTALQDGTYANLEGNQFTVMQQNNNRVMESNGVSANCQLCENIIQEGEQIKVRLSNGKNVEIKVMPDTASETALERLRLRTCDEDCTIELKETGEGEKIRAVYEVKTQRNSKFLGLFNAEMNVQAQVDAETGELVQVKKPWWAFLASEKE